jgi:hypothetical protein
VNQLYENQSVRKGDACITELHFRNIGPPQKRKKDEEYQRQRENVNSRDADSGKVQEIP